MAKERIVFNVVGISTVGMAKERDKFGIDFETAEDITVGLSFTASDLNAVIEALLRVQHDAAVQDLGIGPQKGEDMFTRMDRVIGYQIGDGYPADHPDLHRTMRVRFASGGHRVFAWSRELDERIQKALREQKLPETDSGPPHIH